MSDAVLSKLKEQAIVADAIYSQTLSDEHECKRNLAHVKVAVEEAHKAYLMQASIST